MRRVKLLLGFLALPLFAGTAAAADEPIYDEKADANQQIAAAIAAASESGKPARNIVLVFGANWCPDCHALDDNMRKPELASIIEQNFVVVKIDVGRMNKHLEVAKQQGVLIRRGIPALAVLDAKGKVLYAMDQGQFADARHMSFESIRAFFEQWRPKLWRSMRSSMLRLFNVIKDDGNVAAEADFAPHNRNDMEKPQV